MDTDTCNVCEAAAASVECVECGVMQFCGPCADKLHSKIAGLRSHTLRPYAPGRRSGAALPPPPPLPTAADVAGTQWEPHDEGGEVSREGELEWYAAVRGKVRDHRSDLRQLSAAVRELRDRGLAVEEAETREVKLKFAELRRVMNKTEELLLKEVKTKSERRKRDAAELTHAGAELDQYFATCEDLFRNDGALFRKRLRLGRNSSVGADDFAVLRNGLNDAVASQHQLTDSLVKLRELDAGVFAAPCVLDTAKVVDVLQEVGRAGIGVGPKPAGWALLSSSTVPAPVPSPRAAPQASPRPVRGAAEDRRGSPAPAGRSHSYLGQAGGGPAAPASKGVGLGHGGSGVRRMPSPQAVPRQRHRSSSPPGGRGRVSSNSSPTPARHPLRRTPSGFTAGSSTGGFAPPSKAKGFISSLDGTSPSAAAAFTTSARYGKTRQRELLAKKLASRPSTARR
eukprot:TRINITY_DN32147_c0_g1_i1.p1 TRINITY_DN32147_c0_g1~~TRINITY_DN32147_c0_g1_i1.p1  ORF type:complete len:468 (+),score=116.94 TRINITY_DN32147_c0_g1_i1:45-1406(+)